MRKPIKESHCNIHHFEQDNVQQYFRSGLSISPKQSQFSSNQDTPTKTLFHPCSSPTFFHICKSAAIPSCWLCMLNWQWALQIQIYSVQKSSYLPGLSTSSYIIYVGSTYLYGQWVKCTHALYFHYIYSLTKNKST